MTKQFFKKNHDVTGADALINCNPQYGIHLQSYPSGGAFDTSDCPGEYLDRQSRAFSSVSVLAEVLALLTA